MKKKDCGCNKSPGMLRRMRNAAKAVGRVISTDGKIKVEMQTRVERMDACIACELFDGGICTHEECGCVCRLKTMLATESCPIGKW